MKGTMCTLLSMHRKINGAIGVGRNLLTMVYQKMKLMYLLRKRHKESYTINLDKHWAVWRSFPEKRGQMVCIDYVL